MATKLKNDFWSVVAVAVALFSLLYCFSFIFDIVLNLPAFDLLAFLREMPKGEA